jgi:prevent-host-death family protein
MPKKSCGAEEARANLPELLERAHRGVATVITKRGQPYAILTPVAGAKRGRRGPSLSELRGSGRGLWGENAAETLSTMREEWE